MANPQIFISYRREDGSLSSFLLAKFLLNNSFSVFYDKTSLRQGLFPDIIHDAIKDCEEFILVITKEYFSQRIFNEDDWVRKEIRLALKYNKHIIPYIVGTKMPEKNSLPEDIRLITDYNSIFQIDVEQFDEINQKLISEYFVAVPKTYSLADIIKNRSSIYDADFGDEETRLLIQSRNARANDMRVLDKLFANRNKIRVLDVGCAYGYVGRSRFADEKYEKIIGIDKNENCLKYARSNNIDEKFEYYCTDIEDINFEKEFSEILTKSGVEQFDLIFITLVLHHLGNAKAFLRKIRKYLAPNGYIFVRSSDDGSKLSSESQLLNQIISKTLSVKGVSDRCHGRKLYSLLVNSGYFNVRVYSYARETSGMSLDEKCNLFNESFSYRINYFKKNMSCNNPRSIADFNEMEELLATFEDKFYNNDFWYCEYDYIGVGTLL